MAPARSGRAAPKATAPRRSPRGARLGDPSFGLSAGRWRYLKQGKCTRPSSETDASARPQHGGILDRAVAVVIGHVGTGLEEVLEIGLQRPAGLDLVGVADLDHRLVIARDRLIKINVQAMRLAGDTRIGEADCKRIGGAPGDHAGEGDAAVGVEVDDIAVGWCADDAGKHPHAYRVLASRHTP